jgi:GNAT superfamily N-acetyltransferase
VTTIRTTDADEAARLIASGARLQRHAHDMQLELGSMVIPVDWVRPTLSPTLRLTSIDRAAVDVARASLGAYGPGHVDTAQGASLPEAVATYDRLLQGRTAGPVLQALSSLVVELHAETVAAAVIVTAPPETSSWKGGSWLCDLFVVPSHQGAGLGRQLLQRLIAKSVADGYLRVGLSVTNGNPAERLYESVGFRRYRSIFVVEETHGSS